MRRVALWAAGATVLACCGPDEPPPPPPPNLQEGQAIYDEKCVSCHTLGGGVRTGPDLHGVTRRRSHDWLVRWLEDPVTMEKTDPIGRQLFVQFKSIPMVQPRLNDAQIRDVLAFIEKESVRLPAPVKKQ